ncbi:MAG: hypothetical protein ABIO02_01555, partial [Patescibacteria group bacterium]
ASYGMNSRPVALLKDGVAVATAFTAPDANGPGAFAFTNVQAGNRYQVCTNNPGNAVFYCSNSGIYTSPEFCNEFDVEEGEYILNKYIVLRQDPATCTPATTSTPPPSPTPTPSPTRTPTPTPSRAPTPFITSGFSTPTPTPFKTPTPSISSKPTPSPTPNFTPSPTPTSTVVIITATPTPTPIIVVAATNTPTPGTGIATTVPNTPTIPSAGSPLPYIALGIPFVLILLAFIL